MTSIEGDEPLSLLAMPPPPGFELRAVRIAAGRELAYEEAQWHDAIVVVEEGEVEVECRAGGRRRFHRGDVLCLSGLALRALRNPSSTPVLLVAASRRVEP